MTHPNLQTYNILKMNLDAYNIILKRSIQLQKKVLMMLASKNTKRTWKTISEILNKTKKEKFPTILSR